MNDRVAVVTGGSKGIGIAVARRFAESGARVAILARGAQDLKTAREELAKDGLDVRDYVCDVSKAADISKAHDRIVADLGKIDVLVKMPAGARWRSGHQRRSLAGRSICSRRSLQPAGLAGHEAQMGRIINVLNTYAKAPAVLIADFGLAGGRRADQGDGERRRRAQHPRRAMWSA
jgi:NAD(P)-dependent dehydrogenase (short-subunit alcohol dehydrogenase family)